jgi:hypothetical protein
MTITLTEAQVRSLAPDDASARAASGLVGDANWVTLGSDTEALWGECKGSGAKPYQAQVDLAALAAKCSCPSRKFPCKHGLALMLMYAKGNPRVTASARPAWLDEWMSARKDKAHKKEKAAADKPAVDPVSAAAAAAKREASRWQKIEAGARDLQLWIADAFRRGLGQFGAEQRKAGLAMAARLVDAQAPGLAAQLERALEAARPGASDELIERLGLLAVLAEGIARREALSPARRADLRAAAGWPLDKEDVLAEGERVEDAWLVVGQLASGLDEKLAERRVWLHGQRTGRAALLLDYALKGKAFDGAWDTGAAYAATLAFYPGSAPLRALVASAPTRIDATAWPEAAAIDAIDGASQHLADNPFLAQVPLLFAQAVLVFAEATGWRMHTPDGRVPLRVPDDAGWNLLALGGGGALRVMGEWDGRALRPLAAWRDGDAQAAWVAAALAEAA